MDPAAGDTGTDTTAGHGGAQDKGPERVEPGHTPAPPKRATRGVHAADSTTQAAGILHATGAAPAKESLEGMAEARRTAIDVMRAATEAANAAASQALQGRPEDAASPVPAAVQHTAGEPSTALPETRALPQPPTPSGRALVDRWLFGVEATFRAACDVQNATLTAGLALLDATNNATHEITGQWSSLAHQTQDAVLHAWQRGLTSTDEEA